MAMNLGYDTKMLVIGRTTELMVGNDEYDTLIGSDGLPANSKVHPNNAAARAIYEKEYIDLGIITSENEDLTAGGIAISVPTGGAASRINWSIGGRVLRVTISGIIPDGTYVANSGNPLDTDASKLNGMSNVSVFRYKINKWFGYTSLLTPITEDRTISPNTVQYRRYYMKEKDKSSWSGLTDDSELASYVVTNYSFSLIEGTRHGQYSMTLDFSNDLGTPTVEDSDDGISPTIEGDL